MKKGRKLNEGFTTIEVVLVLALAGLIFLMAFIALPQLQRSQRDAERKDDMMMFTEAVKKYMTNNRGMLPANGEPDKAAWGEFVKEYIDSTYNVNDGTAEDFGDPRDNVYKLDVQECSSGATCGNQDYGWDTTIHIFTQGVCEQDHAIKGSNPREFAVVYRTESSGVYCFDSSS